MSSLTFEVDYVNGNWGFWGMGFTIEDFKSIPKFIDVKKQLKQRDGSTYTVIISQLLSLPTIIASIPKRRYFFDLYAIPDFFDENVVIKWVGHLKHLPLLKVMIDLATQGIPDASIMVMGEHPTIARGGFVTKPHIG